jgi:hypothetical protein
MSVLFKHEDKNREREREREKMCVGDEELEINIAHEQYEKRFI